MKTVPRVIPLTAPVYVVQVGWVKHVANVLASMVCTVPTVRRFASAKTIIQSSAIPGPGNVLAKWDGTAKLVPGRAPSIHSARVVRIAATARITRSVHPSTALVSARPDIAERIAASSALRTPSVRTARKSAPAKTVPLARLRTDGATARLDGSASCAIVRATISPMARTARASANVLTMRPATRKMARARVRLASPAHCVRIVVKRASLETDAIRLATVPRRTPWTVTPLPGIASVSRNGEEYDAKQSVRRVFTGRIVTRIANA